MIEQRFTFLQEAGSWMECQIISYCLDEDDGMRDGQQTQGSQSYSYEASQSQSFSQFDAAALDEMLMNNAHDLSNVPVRHPLVGAYSNRYYRLSNTVLQQ